MRPRDEIMDLVRNGRRGAFNNFALTERELLCLLIEVALDIRQTLQDKTCADYTKDI